MINGKIKLVKTPIQLVP